jgi:hypothetical protein
MNEQESTRLVQQFYQSQKAGDFQSLLNSLAIDVQAVDADSSGDCIS